MTYTIKFDGLSIASIDKNRFGERGGMGYRYTIRSNSYGLAAFEKRANAIRWLEERGLSLPEPLAEEGVAQFQAVTGHFFVHLTLSYARFADAGVSKNRVCSSRQLENGDYTESHILSDENGVRHIWVLNPNCKDRLVYDYAESRAHYG